MASAPGYPQVMVHPQHAPAVMASTSSNPNDPDYGLPGRPERFPPIEVHNEDQEAETRSRGYLRYGEQMPATAQYSEYPKMLSHPDHVPPTPPTKGQRMENGGVVTFDIPGKPGRFPDVTVHNEDEEAEWAAKGYSAPASDSIAYERALAAPGKPGAEWPKWVDGVLTQDPDAPVDLSKDYPKWLHFENGESVLVKDPAHEARVLQSRPGDRVATPPHAPAPYVPLVSTPALDDTEYREFLAWKAHREREELIAQAEERDIKIDRRWGIERLREAVSVVTADG
jgi:hypothetical protein